MADGEYFMGQAQAGVGNLMAGAGPPQMPGGFNLSRLGISDNPVLNMLSQMGIGHLMGQMGMAPGTFFPQGNYAGAIRQRQYFLEQQEAMRRAAPADMHAMQQVIQGGFQAIGVPLSPEVRDFAAQAGRFIEPFTPIAAQMFPKQFDQFLGASGSMMGLARGIHEAGRTSIDPATGAMGMTGQTAGFMAQDLYRSFYGAGADPSAAKGLGGTELGNLFVAMRQRGMVRPTDGMLNPASIASAISSPEALQALAKVDPEAIAGLTRAANPVSGDMMRRHGLGLGDTTSRLERIHRMGMAGAVTHETYEDMKSDLGRIAEGDNEADWSMPRAGSYMARKMAEASPENAKEFAGLNNLDRIRENADRLGLGEKYNEIRGKTTALDLAENNTAMGVVAKDFLESKDRVSDLASTPAAVRAGLDQLHSSAANVADYAGLKGELGLSGASHEEFATKVANDPELARKAVEKMADMANAGQDDSWYRATRAYTQAGASRDPGAKNTQSQVDDLTQNLDKVAGAVQDLEKTDPEKYNRLAAALQSGGAKKALTNIAGAVSAMSDVFGSKGITGVSMDTLLQGVSNLTAGAQTAVSGSKLEMMVRRASTSAESSGMGIDRYQLAVQQGSALAQQQGLSGKFGADIGEATSVAFAASRDGSGVGVDNFYKDTPEAVAATRARLRAQGLASQAGNNLGAISRAVRRADESGDASAASPELRRAAYAIAHGGVDEQGRRVDMSKFERPDEVLKMLTQGTNMGREGAALFMGNRRANTAELYNDPEKQATLDAMQQGERIRMNTSMMQGGVATTLRGLGISGTRANRMSSDLARDLNQAVMGVGPNGMSQGEALDEKTRNLKGAAVIAQRLGKNFDQMSDAEKSRLTQAANDMYGQLDAQLGASGKGSIATMVQQSGQETLDRSAKQRVSDKSMAELDAKFASTNRQGPVQRLTESFKQAGQRSMAGDNVDLLGGIIGHAGKFLGGVTPDEAKKLTGPAPSPDAQAAWDRFHSGFNSVMEGKVTPATTATPATETKPETPEDDKAGAAPVKSRGDSPDNPLHVQMVPPKTGEPISEKGHQLHVF